MKKLACLIIGIGLFSCYTAFSQTMTIAQMDKIFKSAADSVRGDQGRWQIKYKEIWIYVITDVNNNRMRIIAPIAKVDELEEKHFIKSLEANFHTALDIKYAISDGLMWSIFVHPFKELTSHQITDALSQVYSGVATFGYTYSSGELMFPGND